MAAISVIVPIYKVKAFLHRCVDSILAQTFADFDLVLVDDGSPDSCGDICEEYARKDGRIHVIHQKNGGLSAEPGFPENKGRKALCAEDHDGNATQPADIGLFQYGEKRGKDGIQKSLYRKIPRHSVQAEPETAGGDPCLQQENAHHKLRRTGEHPAGRGLRQKPLQHK